MAEYDAYRDVIRENPGAVEAYCHSLMSERTVLLKQRGRPDSPRITQFYIEGVDACIRANEVYPVPNFPEPEIDERGGAS